MRKLAEVAGTSDRMLIYYFETKDALIGQVLQGIASNLAAQLDALLGEDKRSAADLLTELYSLSSVPQFYATIQFWFEVTGLAARTQEPYAEQATVIAENWLQWIEGKLEDAQRDQALKLFAELEGRFMLKIVGIESNFMLH
ncbi:MAG: TetR/AcrR family transcriptional regulator [Caldilineaceae bacterium]